MKLKNRKTAFSLIEISVVILIIGLIIAGIVQGSRMITKSKLTSARSLTNASPALVIPGLKLWLDATAVNAFSLTDPSTGDALPLWQEINKPSSDIITAAASTTKPIYKSKGISGLPAASFSSPAKYFDLPDSTLPTNNDPFTLFVVTSGTSSGPLLGTGGDKFVSGKIINIATNGANFGGSTNYAFSTSVATIDKVITIVYTGGASKLLTIYINGYTDTTLSYQRTIPTLYGIDNLSTYHRVGYATSTSTGYGTPYLTGEIGEILTFDRELATDEISDINQYLIKKWKLKAL